MARYLRFPPHEYRTLCRLGAALDLGGRHPGAVRRLLAESLADTHPALAGRLDRLRRREVKVLCDHLRGLRPPPRHGLTAQELRTLAAFSSPLLSHARFLGPLWRALIQQLRGPAPALAAKLDRLSRPQVEALCRQLAAAD
jgi:hypothetical protein